MRSNTKVLAWLYIVLGVIGVLAGILTLVILTGTGFVVGDRDAAAILTTIGIVVAVVVTVISAPNIIAGIGLLKFKPWARVLAIVLAFLNLFGFPLGTILAVYTFISLLNSEASQLFVS